MVEEREEGAKVRALIEKATNSTLSEVDPRLLKAIKLLVRYSDSELRLAAQTLMDLMKRDHSQVRYLALLIIDELFMRSKLFRTLFVENMDQLLTLSVGFRRNLPLPAPPAVALTLRSKAIEFLEKWNASFGIHYRRLRLGFDYLKNTLRLQFPNLQANAARIQHERKEREKRSKEILLKKFEMLKENFSLVKEEIQLTVDEISECLDIVRTGESSVKMDPLGDEDSEDFRSSELRQIRLDALKEGDMVHENSDNKVVFDALRELYKVLVTKHLVSVQEWISILIRVDVEDIRSRDCLLKESIDIRNHLHAVKKKCEDSGFLLPSTTNHNDKEEEFWEEGKIEAIENGTSSMPVVKKIVIEHINEESGCSETQVSEGGGTDLRPLRSKLLAEAPVRWGSFLDTSEGSNRGVPANQRGLELESHWGRVDFDAIIPAEKIAELNVRATLYKEEQQEIKPCRAPLSKGEFCQRRDLRVCPFHGPMVPRDDEGKPLDEKSQVDNITHELGTDLVEKLARKAVKNVRERDKEAVKKLESDKQMVKRAKLAKIREHNDAVLRDAAFASTSRSAFVGEDRGTTGGETSSAKNKKQTLASMVRKKVTTKDRLAQRLLNTRAKDATTRQLTLDEDSNYREAFPNQW